MKHPLLALVCLVLLLAPAPAAAAQKIYLTVERGSVLFLVERNRWEPAPNYLRLRAGDVLKVMPGTVGTIDWNGEADYNLPISEAVTIEADGISQLRDGHRVVTRFRDGMYFSDVIPDDGRALPEIKTPRPVEIYPSPARKAVRRNEVNATGDWLRARLDQAGGTVLEESIDAPPTRFSPMARGDRHVPRVARIEEPERVLEASLRASVDGSDREKALRQIVIERGELARLAREICALEATIAQKVAAGTPVADDRAELARRNRDAHARSLRLRDLEFRDRNLRTARPPATSPVPPADAADRDDRKE